MDSLKNNVKSWRWHWNKKKTEIAIIIFVRNRGKKKTTTKTDMIDRYYESMEKEAGELFLEKRRSKKAFYSFFPPLPPLEMCEFSCQNSISCILLLLLLLLHTPICQLVTHTDIPPYTICPSK
jgi:hypothetical protein